MGCWNVLGFVCLSVVATGHTYQWPTSYYVEGFLRLPYAEINEPFIGWYEGEKNRSRIDYYDTVSTYQIGGKGDGDYGYDLKVAPMTTEELLNVKTCFRLNGTDSYPVTSQILLPDLSDFQIVESEVMHGENCTVFYKVVKVEGRKNSYKFYQNTKTGAPIRYEIVGYDTLLGSHYDRYYFDYTKYIPVKSFSGKIFTPPNGLTCRSFPGPGVHRATTNPMNEYLHHDDSHVDEAFHDFKKNHGKQYDDHSEHAMRKAFFHQNLRYIHSKNRQGLSFTLAVNHLADKSNEELRLMRGSRKSSVKYNGGLPFNRTEFDFTAPPYFDWRLFGAVTPVKDQATCGSCWSFGTTGCVEGAHFLKTGELVRLSSQELVDCSWGEGNNGCDGGEDFRAYQWIMKHGLASEEDYGAYLGQDGYCKMKTVKPTAFLKGYVNITSGDSEAVKLSMFKYGPISVAIDASHKSLSFYSNGVYYEPNCGSKMEDLDHAVLAVGYGTLNGEDYWLVKNSWSTYWGNDGYILMSQKDNNCGVATAATYVIM